MIEARPDSVILQRFFMQRGGGSLCDLHAGWALMFRAV